MTLALLSLAGALGALCRVVADDAARRRSAGVLGIVAVNVSGSLLLGLLTGLVLRGAPALLQTVLGTGFCGGYTTFSTASVDTVRLLRQGRAGAALAHAAGTLLLAVLAAAAGLGLAAHL